MKLSLPSETCDTATGRGWGLVSENPRQASCILCARNVLQEGRRWSPLTAKTANVEFTSMQWNLATRALYFVRGGAFPRQA